MISIRNMKTKEQILDWLNKQPWKGEFYESAFLNRESTISYDKNFLFNAFNWVYAKPSGTVWAKRNNEFLKWYLGSKPTSWEEYCDKNPITDDACYIDDSSIITPICDLRPKDADNDVNVMTKELCEAFLAYMKLIQLRNAWVKNGDENLYRIVWSPNRGFWCVRNGHNGLSFSTEALADEFIGTFKDLLEVAKPLI